LNAFRLTVVFELPRDFPIVERVAVRTVVVERDGGILLFLTRDPTAPELGQWWELPGGGVEEGETLEEAAQRELREETGIVASLGQIGPPSWRRQASFQYRGTRRLQNETVVSVRLEAASPTIHDAGRLEHEKEDYIDSRWWSVGEIMDSPERFYPCLLYTSPSPRD